MKRVGHLYEKILDPAVIDAAICEASRGKRHRTSVKRVLADKPKYIAKLQETLANDAVELSPYRVFNRYDHRAGKTRTIRRPRFFPDQIIHWLVVTAIKPVIMKGMDFWCCGSVPRRGIKHGHRAIRAWLRDDRKGTKYCLKMDVKKFYDSIPHDALIAKLRGKIKDERMLALLQKIVDTTEAGVPIGNYTSQWMANFFMEGLDHYIRETLKAKHYVRYIDDIVILGGNKKALHGMHKKIAAYLRNNLGLSVKENWQVFKIASRGIDFLGYVFYHGYTTLRDRNFLALVRQAKTVHKLVKAKMRIPRNIAAGMISRIGQLNWCNSYLLKLKHLKGITLKKLTKAVSYASKKQLQPCAV